MLSLYSAVFLEEQFVQRMLRGSNLFLCNFITKLHYWTSLLQPKTETYNDNHLIRLFRTLFILESSKPNPLIAEKCAFFYRNSTSS